MSTSSRSPRTSPTDPTRSGGPLELRPGWASAFRGVDAVLHLAADRRPEAPWDSLQRLNLDLSMNVLRAAEEGQVRRFAFASSNWVLGGTASPASA